MSGTGVCHPPSLASKLRNEADEVNDRHDATKLEAVYEKVIKEAKASAKLGNYSVKVYHEYLTSEEIVRALRKKLDKDGFTCSKVCEDDVYSTYSRQAMYFITVSW